MRNFLVKCILRFARLITLPLPRWKQASIMYRVRSQIRTDPVNVATTQGHLLFETELRDPGVIRGLETDTVEYIGELPDGSCFWDVGANIGLYSLHAGLQPGVRVVAFEPSASSFAALNENIRLNGMSDRIRAYAVALAGSTRLDTLNMENVRAGSWNNGFGVETNQFGDAIEVGFRQGAVGFSIDDFVAGFGAPAPTHVKIDVDGIEADILRGGRSVLSQPSVSSMIVEIEGDFENQHNQVIFGLMADLGFAPRPKASPALRNVIFDKI